MTTPPMSLLDPRSIAFVVVASISVAGAASTAAAQVDWRELQPAVRPPAMFSRDRMVYDTSRQRVVLVRGLRGPGAPATVETWEWDRATWTRATPASSPPIAQFELVYDAARSLVVWLGGGDTWVWDGVSWRRVATGGPNRNWPSMAYDGARREVVLFGGASASQPSTTWPTDTWTWNGVAWTRLTSVNAPPGRHVAGMAYDERRREVVLFGGTQSSFSTVRGDTWVWDGSNWQQRAPVQSPAARTTNVMVRDAARDRIVVYGGDTAGGAIVFYRDTWEWDGTTWIARQPPNSPRANWLHVAAAYDVARGQTVLFGGSDSSGFPGCCFENATWVYGPVNPGGFSPLGAGCAGSNGVPGLELMALRLPYVGDSFEIAFTSLPPAPLTALLVLGAPEAGPVSMSTLGMPGCFRHVVPETTLLGSVSGGTWSWVLSVPMSSGLIGYGVGIQGLFTDPGVNTLGVVASNAALAVVGSK